MKFLLHVFLVTLINFLVMKTGLGLSCATVEYDDSACLPLQGMAYVKCWTKYKKTRVDKCEFDGSQCLSYTIKLIDGTQIVYKACDYSQLICNAYKHETEEKIDSKYIKHSQCEFCKRDLCNSGSIVKPSGSNPSDSESDHEGESIISCQYVNYDSNPCDFLKGSDFFKCWSKHKVEKIEECESRDAECLTYTLKVKEDTKFVYKSCDLNRMTCKTYKKLIEEPLLRKGGLFDESKCEFCTGNLCNKDEEVGQRFGEDNATRTAPIPVLVFLFSTRLLFQIL